MIISAESFDPSLEIGVYRFGSFLQWRQWRQVNPWFGFLGASAEIAEHCLSNGLHSGWFGRIAAEDVKCASTNYRESLLGHGLNSRQRAILEVSQLLINNREKEVMVYAAEGITRFARILNERCPHFIGSEYAPSLEEQVRIAPVVHQDLAALTFVDSSFDLCITNEVLEHLPDLNTSLSELCRVLRPGGVLLSTFPFLHNRHESLVKAKRLADGSIHYLTEPEYHGNPVDPSGGSLVFQVPGWDIIECCRRAGFVHAEMLLLSSRKAGLVSTHYPGIFLLFATAA